MRPVRVTVGDLADDAAGIASAQLPSSDTYMTLDGPLVVDGVAILPAAQQVVLTSAGDDTGVTFTVTGRNQDNQPISEDVTGANAGAATTDTFFTKVESIYVVGNVDVTVSAGALMDNGAVSHTIQADWRQPNFTVGMAIDITGSGISCTVQDTYNAIQTDPYLDWVWHDNGSLTNVTSSTVGNFNAPVIGVRLKVNTGYTSGSATLTYVQAIGD